jgi:hypothetical protein
MRLAELQKPVDVMEISLYDAQVFFINNPHIVLESAHNNKEYRTKIDNEKLQTVDIIKMVKGQKYAPVQILGISVGKYINIQSVDGAAEFIKEYNNKLWFRSSTMRDITFPAHDTNMGDQCTDILIFNNINERDQFFSALKLSFSDWHFKITNR